MKQMFCISVKLKGEELPLSQAQPGIKWMASMENLNLSTPINLSLLRNTFTFWISTGKLIQLCPEFAPALLA